MLIKTQKESYDPSGLKPMRTRTDYIIIHDTRTRGKSYMGFKEILKFYEVNTTMELPIHFLINPRNPHSTIRPQELPEGLLDIEKELEVIPCAPLNTAGNHSGKLYDASSISIVLIGNFAKSNQEVTMKIMTHPRLFNLVLGLAQTFNIPAENILTITEAIAILAARFEYSSDHEILYQHWDTTPSSTAVAFMAEFRDTLVASGVQIHDPEQYKFLRHFDEFIGSRGNTGPDGLFAVTASALSLVSGSKNNLMPVPLGLRKKLEYYQRSVSITLKNYGRLPQELKDEIAKYHNFIEFLERSGYSERLIKQFKVMDIEDWIKLEKLVNVH